MVHHRLLQGTIIITTVSPTMLEETPLYVPPNPKATRCFAFLDKVNARYDTSLESYHDLYTWSTQHIDLFWSLVWDDVTILGDKGNHIVDAQAVPASNPSWFREAKVNWAENMLRCRSEHKIALIQASMSFHYTHKLAESRPHATTAEPTPDYPTPPDRVVTYAQLYAIVADLVSALLHLGLKPGDRVASYSSNCVVCHPGAYQRGTVLDWCASFAGKRCGVSSGHSYRYLVITLFFVPVCP